MQNNDSIVVSALYNFVKLDNYRELQQPLLDLLLKHKIRGTLLLANEGINGTVAGSREAIDKLYQWLSNNPDLHNTDSKESLTGDMPFYRSKVKLKKEIVTLGVEGIDPRHVVGTYVKPKDWNALISDPEVTVIDTRNDYEIGIGTFKGAIDPNTKTFRDFPDYVKENLNPEKHKKVAMFCTGGIRCEKSTAYLKEQGFEDVYHLEGGILKYLEEVNEQDSLWQGECFVFDNRVSVNHRLEKGEFDQCHACRRPILETDKQRSEYQAGISCHQCINEYTDEQRARFKERERQIQLAKKRGEQHIGNDAAQVAKKRKTLKLAKKKASQQQSSRA